MDLIKFIFDTETSDELYIKKRISVIKCIEMNNGCFKYNVYYGTSQHLILEEIDSYCTKCTELSNIVYYLKQNTSYIILKEIELYLYYLSLLDKCSTEKTVNFSKILGMIYLDESDVDGLEYKILCQLGCDVECDYEDKKVNELINYQPSDQELINYFKI